MNKDGTSTTTLVLIIFWSTMILSTLCMFATLILLMFAGDRIDFSSTLQTWPTF